MTRWLTRPLVATMAGMLLLLACGTDPKQKAKHPGIDLGAPDIAWKDKSPEQRMGFMASVVHPQMKQLFIEHDKESYADFSCETCHGSDLDIRDFAMPSDELYALPKAGAIKEAMDYDQEVAEFMMAKVVPELEKLLNQGEGGSVKADCFSCHPIEE